MQRSLETFLAAAMGLVFATTAGLADDTGRDLPKDSKLPGVEGGYSIVAPAPEPLDDQAGDGNTIKAGKWELTVSGYVWVQIGASSAKRRRR